jgi:hypothetical protein
MSPILLIAAALGAGIAWILLSGLRTIVGQEAVGRTRRLARALIRHSARGLPEPQRALIIRDLLAELESPEMRETPFSQLAMALDIWLHSSSLRTSIWPKAESPDQAYFRIRGLLVGVTGLLSASAVWSATYYTQSLPAAGAIAAGVVWGVTYIWIERVMAAPRRANSWALQLPRLVMQTVASAVVALAVEFWVFRSELLVAAQASDHGHPSGVFEAVTVLQSMPNTAVVIWALQLIVLLFFLLPTAADVFRAKTQPQLYEAND